MLEVIQQQRAVADGPIAPAIADGAGSAEPGRETAPAGGGGGVPAPPNRTGLPDALKARAERLSGIPLDDVRVRYDSLQPQELDALAYARGSEIHLGPGQEKHLGHELWHVVQQKQGRVEPTLQFEGLALNADAAFEREADAAAAEMSADRTGPSPAGNLDPAVAAGAPVVQRTVHPVAGAGQQFYSTLVPGQTYSTQIEAEEADKAASARIALKRAAARVRAGLPTEQGHGSAASAPGPGSALATMPATLGPWGAPSGLAPGHAAASPASSGSSLPPATTGYQWGGLPPPRLTATQDRSPGPQRHISEWRLRPARQRRQVLRRPHPPPN
ncbi:MAG TPA: DUF4157 domain-containing protein [Allosphingosinicella sp.]|nr:DUF4157 domain-containing protein [Allosphingosinicella sp.]